MKLSHQQLDLLPTLALLRILLLHFVISPENIFKCEVWF